MSTPTSTTPATTSTKASEETKNALATSAGKISVADGVVSKIAGLAAREISGVHAMGAGATRAFGAIKQRIPGSSGPSVSQGVSVEVGETRPRSTSTSSSSTASACPTWAAPSSATSSSPSSG